MTLQQLFRIFGKIHWQQALPEQVVLGVTSDSRKIQKDFVFVAVHGVHSDGHDFLSVAVDNGACALVVEKKDRIPANFRGAVLEVLDSALAYNLLLSEFYSHPEEKLISIGITGTNGKTSTAYLVEHFLNFASIPCGVMGTIDHHFQKHQWQSPLTTPDTATFYRRLQDFVDAGAKAYVMEVSSHSLKQKRVSTRFDIALFTNFTRDHLDYHQTMEDYFASKEKLFTEHLKSSGDVFAVLNADDPLVRQVRVAATAQTVTFGQTTTSDFCYRIVSADIDGTTFEVCEFGKTKNIYRTTMVGGHNVANCVGALAIARCLGVSMDLCEQALKTFLGVPGRLQRVPNRHRRHVFVDYAHTPDALEKVLQALRAMSSPSSNLITVFGCGGDRDQGKRPLMRQVAEKLSQKMIITSDNPRSEDPQKIIEQILAGSTSPAIVVEADREKALEKALALSKPEDIILVAGKGHEDYQILGEQTISFSDYQKMKEFLEKDKL